MAKFGHFLFFKDPMTLIQEIENHVRPILAANRYELVEVQYRNESGRWILRIFIDKIEDQSQVQEASQAGSPVTLDDCEKVSDLIGNSLESTAILGKAYVLEVSSPGINRPLKSESHFASHVGQKVRVSLYSSLDPEGKQKNFSGTLLSCADQSIDLADSVSGRVRIPISAISKAHLDLI